MNYEEARLEMMINFVRVLEHTKRLVISRGFTSLSHEEVIRGCHNALASLERGGEMPLAVFESFNDQLVGYQRETYMIKPLLRVVV